MFRQTLATLALSVAALALPQAASAHPAKVHHARHQYVYYPVHEIYFEPATRLWFWADAGRWRSAAALPVYYRGYTSGGIHIVLDSHRPYHHHADVVYRYGRGPRVVEHHYVERRPVVVHHHHQRGPHRAQGPHRHHGKPHHRHHR